MVALVRPRREAARVLVVTSGALSTCPRMLKVADALQDAGYDTRVVSVLLPGWPRRFDPPIAQGRTWDWRPVRLDGCAGLVRRKVRGLRRRLGERRAGRGGPGPTPAPGEVERLQSPHADLLCRTARTIGADLVYGGAAGGMVPAWRTARRLGVPFALDVEDLYSEEAAGAGDGALRNRLARCVEERVLPQAAFVTAGSAGIAEAYRRHLGIVPSPVHNVFPRPRARREARGASRGPLRLYWFSQTIAGDRGIEDVVAAAARAGVDASLTLQGRPVPGYRAALTAEVRAHAPRLRVRWLPPTHPGELDRVARQHDVGLCLERRSPRNRDLCVANKVFALMTAGLALVLTDTTGQRAIAADVGPDARLYAPGDVEALAGHLRVLADDPGALERARAASLEAARRRWHWEHPLERGRVLDLVAGALA